MTRKGAAACVLATIAAAAALGVAPTVRATPAANVVCPSFTVNGHKIAWEVIGTWTCKTAKPWVVKFDNSRVKKQVGNVPLHNGPAHYHCFASLTAANGHVIDGLCYLGTLAFPKSGFTW